MKPTVLLVVILLFAPAVRGEEPMGRDLVRKLLDAETDEARGALTKALLALEPSTESLARWFAAGRTYRGDVRTGWQKKWITGSDGVRRPWLLHAPENYDPAKKHRLLIDLHGGVSRPECLTHEELEGMKYFWGGHAEEHGYFLALPTGQKGAEWWTPVGSGNVLGILEAIKRTYNIDEDRVVATGFSDGGSGSFYLALTHPTPFAAFVPLNGHVGVAGVGGLQIHLRNLTMKPLYVVNTENDSLYPSAGVRPLIEALQKLGGEVVWRDLPGYRHEPTYLDEERPAIWAFMKRQKRVADPRRIVWEGTAGAPSRVHWLHVTGVGETGNDVEFPDVNPELTDRRVRLGVTVDPAFEGPGVRIETVQEGSAAAGAGLRPGDILRALDATEIRTLSDLRSALGQKKRGDRFEAVVRRGGQSLDLEGRFPAASSRPAFARTKPYGSIEVTVTGNRIEAWVRRITSFELFLSPRLVNLEKPVTVSVNGMVVFRDVVPGDPSFLIARALADRDRSLVYSTRLAIEVPSAR